MITNGNFNSDPNRSGTWRVDYDNTKQIPRFTWDDKTYYGTSGNSLRIECVENSGSVFGLIYNQIGITPGNTYSFSAFGKGENITQSRGLIIFIGQYDINNKLIDGTDNFFIQDGTFDWQIANVEIVADQNARSVKIELILDGSGYAWFDDISLINRGVIPGSVEITSFAIIPMLVQEQREVQHMLMQRQ